MKRFIAFLKRLLYKRWLIETYSCQLLKGGRLNPDTKRYHQRRRRVFSKSIIKDGVC